MAIVKFELEVDDPRLPQVLALLGASLASPPAEGAIETAEKPARGSYVLPDGRAVLDDEGVQVVANPRNASARYLAGLRLLASRADVSETELMKAVGATTLAGHKAATTKRVKGALGGHTGAVLFHVHNGKVEIAPETRAALARYFGLAR